MTTEKSPPSAPLTSVQELVDYAGSLDCIHCGLCLQSCPTYRLSGRESASPRGRVHLMRAVGEGRLEIDGDYQEELDYCLMCRHCESVCPAGVRFGEMMAFARNETEARLPRSPLVRALRWMGLRVVLPSRIALRLVGSGLRALQLLRIDLLLGRLAGEHGKSLAHLPRVPALSGRRLLPRRVQALQRAPDHASETVTLLEGCVQAELFSRVNRATVDSLIRLGVECRVPSDVVCCGSLHVHNGDSAGSRTLARRMIAAFEKQCAADGSPLPIVVNSPGCSAHMKELGSLFEAGDGWYARASALSARVRDYTEYVDGRLGTREIPLAGVPDPITWDAPCHLCHGQGVRAQPHSILRRMTGVEIVPLPDEESCCGSAGIYSLLRPADAQAVFEPKLEALRQTGARLVVTANPGCQMQWETGLRAAGEDTRVVHLAELVAHGLAAAPGATDPAGGGPPSDASA